MEKEKVFCLLWIAFSVGAAFPTGDEGSGCPEEERFHCPDEPLCIPSFWVCDGEEDCLKGTDESNCSHARNHSTSEGPTDKRKDESTLVEESAKEEQPSPSSLRSTTLLPPHEENATLTEVENEAYEPALNSSGDGSVEADITTEFSSGSPEDTDDETTNATTSTVKTTESILEGELIPETKIRKARRTDLPKPVSFRSIPHLKLLMNMTKEIQVLKKEILEGVNRSCPVNASAHYEKELISKLTCPAHFQFIAGFCLYVQIYPPLTWEESSSLCESQGGRLISIKNNYVLKKVLQQLNFNKQRVYSFWVGGHLGADGFWQWEDGEPIKHFLAYDYSRAYMEASIYHDPKVLGSNRCVFLDGNRSSLMTKGDCRLAKSFICRREIMQHGDKHQGPKLHL